MLSHGEIGRTKDLSAHADVETIIIESFRSPYEEIRLILNRKKKQSPSFTQRVMFSKTSSDEMGAVKMAQSKASRQSEKVIGTIYLILLFLFHTGSWHVLIDDFVEHIILGPNKNISIL